MTKYPKALISHLFMRRSLDILHFASGLWDRGKHRASSDVVLCSHEMRQQFRGRKDGI